MLRGGAFGRVDVTTLVPGHVVELSLGEVVPADIRLVSVVRLECDESVLTGESQPVPKSTEPVAETATLAELSGCALMGTVVHAGSGRGVVVAIGSHSCPDPAGSSSRSPPRVLSSSPSGRGRSPSSGATRACR
ncbi:MULTISPECIES: hypothetical protein [unclassified Terrabacter]|uniref:P-type ATPase n=1 Tax=unclassified Terrabacter TaxID=2630222 RepID=UPI0006FCC1BC|nr:MULTISPECIES: hypothetical protein [unclassified Terrabacter]KRB46025.1 hypothetical protein ASD90_09780 [Terrabacter sp. Root181]KRF38486.1 hypothetical protein ASG96_18845 [Terrabacter sp. Soil810]